MQTRQQGAATVAHQRLASLEKVPAAARRMGISTAQAYREIGAGRIGPLLKTGVRASAVPSESVDRWIADRIAAASKGGCIRPATTACGRMRPAARASATGSVGKGRTSAR